MKVFKNKTQQKEDEQDDLALKLPKDLFCCRAIRFILGYGNPLP